MAEGNTLEEFSLTSDAGEKLNHAISESYLDSEFDSRWLPAKIQLIHNKTLLSAYEEKREECLVQGRTADELVDQYGFIVENSVSGLQTVSTSGFTTHDSDYNALGYSCMGVYLCRHADVCLRHAVVKYSGSAVIRLVVCKYMLGRHTTAIPRVASSADFIQPTQGFDCHISVLPPSKSDSLQSQYDRSQVYLYDINSLLQPLLRPRQLLPYAIVTYTLDGSQPVDDGEMLKSEIPTQLQHIIERINAKAEGHVSTTTHRPSFNNFSRPTSTVTIQPNPNFTSPPLISAVGSNSSASVGKKACIDAETESSDANLQRVIAQINARLESQERSKQLAVRNVNVPTGPAAAAATLQQPPVTQTDVYLAAAAGLSIPRSISDSVALVGASSGRVDAASLGILPVSADSGPAFAGYTGSLAAAAAAHPKITVAGAAAAANVAAGSSYVALAAGGRSAQFAIAPELVGSSSGLPGIHYPSSSPLMSASPYLRALPRVVDTAGVTALDPATMLASQQVKYIPYQSAQGRDVSLVGAASASGLYPLQSVLPADAVGSGYTLVNSGTAVKRSLNDVMLYMVDKRPRYY